MALDSMAGMSGSTAASLADSRSLDALRNEAARDPRACGTWRGGTA